MKSTVEMMELLTKDKDDFYEISKKELSGADDPVRSAILIAATEGFQAGFIAGVKRASE